MSVTTAVKQAQKAAERMMVDTCVISRPSDGPPIRDPETGESHPPPPIEVYDGRCKVQVSSASSTIITGNAPAIVQKLELHIPVSASTPEIGDKVTLTDTPGKPERTGQKFTVAAILDKTFQSAQRLQVEWLA